MRIMPAVVALLTIFMLPWQVSLVAVLGAALFIPMAGIALGVVADLVYYVPGAAFIPYFTLFGLCATGASFLVQRFVKTRIIEG